MPVPKIAPLECSAGTGSVSSMERGSRADKGAEDTPRQTDTEHSDNPADYDDTQSYLSTDSTATLDAENKNKEFCCGLCCFQGCVWGIIAMLYFFVLLPGGLILTWHGYKHKLAVTLALGIVALVLAIFGVPGSFFLFRYCRRKRRDRKDAYRVEKNKRQLDATYENAVVIDEASNKTNITI